MTYGTGSLFWRVGRRCKVPLVPRPCRQTNIQDWRRQMHKSGHKSLLNQICYTNPLFFQYAFATSSSQSKNAMHAHKNDTQVYYWDSGRGCSQTFGTLLFPEFYGKFLVPGKCHWGTQTSSLNHSNTTPSRIQTALDHSSTRNAWYSGWNSTFQKLVQNFIFGSYKCLFCFNLNGQSHQ